MKIQISTIIPNPNNPRKVITQPMIDIKAASMAEVGLLEAIKILALPNGMYMVISGHIRLLAAKQLGWTEIEAEILDLSPAEAMLRAIVDNQGQEMFWLDIYTSLEAMMALNPKMTQKQVAQALVIDAAKASRAVKALPLLNNSAREAILAPCKNSVDYVLSERVMGVLTGIGRGKDFIEEDKKVMEAAVRVVMDRKMPEPPAAKLVAWIQKGNTPESFPASGKIEVQKGSKQQRFDPNDPYAKYWQAMPKSFSSRKKGKGYTLTINADTYGAPLAAYSAAAELTALEQKLGGGDGAPNPYLAALPELRALVLSDAKAEAQAKLGSNQSGSQSTGFGVPNGTVPTGLNQQHITLLIIESLKKIFPRITPQSARYTVITSIVLIIIFFGSQIATRITKFASRPAAAVVVPVVFIPTPTVTQTAGLVLVTQPTATEQVEEKAKVSSKVIVHKLVKRKLVIPTPTAGVVLVSQAPVLADSEGKSDSAPATPAITPAPTVNPDFEKIKSNHFWKLGTQDYEAGDYEGAFGRFIEFSEEGYKIPEIFMWIANCKYNEGLCGDALPFYEKYLEVRPDDAVIKQRVDDCKKLMK